jgi:hypothetical protein
MATTRHLGLLARSLPVVLALALLSGLGVSTPARPDAVARVSAVTVHRAAGQGSAPAVPAHAEQAAVVAAVPVVDRTRVRPAQRVSDVSRSRAPPLLFG